MTAGDWIALGGLFVTMTLALGAVVYRVGRMDERLKGVVRRLERIEAKMDKSRRNNRD